MTNDRGKSGCAASKYFDKVLLGRMTQMIMQMSPGPAAARKHLNRGVVHADMREPCRLA